MNKKIIIKNDSVYLETSQFLPCIWVKDVTKHIPFHENNSYHEEELNRVIDELIKEQSPESSKHSIKGCLKNAIKELKRGDYSLKEFLNEPIARKTFVKAEEIYSLLPHMQTQIEIKEGTLFKHVWEMIEKDAETYNVIFSSALGNYDLNQYIESSKKPFSKEDNDIKNCMNSIELYWGFEINHNDYSYVYPAMHGYGPQDNGDGTTIEGGWSLTFTPINEYMNLPIHLNENVIIRHFISFCKKSDKINFNEISPSINTKKSWTVYDMLYAILDEISFMGTPENQKDEFEKLNDRVIEAEEWMKNKPEELEDKENDYEE